MEVATYVFIESIKLTFIGSQSLATVHWPQIAQMFISKRQIIKDNTGSSSADDRTLRKSIVNSECQI